MRIRRLGGLTCAAVLAAGIGGSVAQASTFFERYMTAKPPCFARAYFPEELKRKPRQTVTNFFVQHAQADPRKAEHPRTFEIEFGYRLRPSQAQYVSRATCRDQGGPIRCSVEGDGGHFTIEPNGDGLRVTVERIVVEGKKDFSPDLAAGDNRVMLLVSSPLTACTTRIP